MQSFSDSILYSYAQIFFSNRRWFGAAVLAATFVTPQLGILALLGVIISNITATVLKFDTEKIRSGFYGFNGILFGAAAAFYFEITPFILLLVLIFIVITFFISAVLENYMAVAFNLPGLSLPFIIALYIFIIFLSNYDFINPGYVTLSLVKTTSVLPFIVSEYLRALSLIVFQPDVISGLIIAGALLFFSRVLFLLSILAFALNLFFLNLILPDMPEAYLILFAFNSILTAFALGGSLIIPSGKSFVLVIIAVLMVVIMTGFFIKLFTGTNFPILVLPFNFIVLSTLYSLKFRKENTNLVLLYFKPGSPEENYYQHQRRKSRFEKFRFLFPELPFFGEWFIPQGFEGQHTHKYDWKYAWDFTVVDEKKSEHSGDGKELSDYYCYKLPVAAPLDGEVVKIVDGIPDNKIGDVYLEKNWGNTIILKHEYGLFSSLSHLLSGSFKVKEGEKINKGQIIAQCGSSGRSPVPHLHFQFQTTDKLGDKTFKFPFAHYIERSDDGFILRTFDYPVENTKVQNVEVHKQMKSAFNFRFGDRLKFNCKAGEKDFIEEWEVKVNMNNELYIESSRNATAGIYVTDKVLYFTNYQGKKDTALYHFSLISMSVPFSYHEKLQWSDVYSVDQFNLGVVRYLSELFLFYKSYISAEGKFIFSDSNNVEEISFCSTIEVRGSSLFSFYHRNYSGEVIIGSNGIIKKFNMKSGNKLLFSAIDAREEERSK